MEWKGLFRGGNLRVRKTFLLLLLILLFFGLFLCFSAFRIIGKQSEAGYEVISEDRVRDSRYGVEFPRKVIENAENFSEILSKKNQRGFERDSEKFTYQPLLPKVLAGSENPFLGRVGGRIEKIDKSNKTVTIIVQSFKVVEVNSENYRPRRNVIYTSPSGARVSASYKGLGKLNIKNGDFVLATVRFEPEDGKGKVLISQITVLGDIKENKKAIEKSKK